MTGGSTNALGSLLSKITSLSAATANLELQLKELRGIDSLLKGMETQGLLAKEVERELDLKKHALKICEEKLADSSYNQIANEILALEASLIAMEQV